MDASLRTTALARHGLLRGSEVEHLPAGERRALVLVQPRVLVAATQPLDVATHVAAAELAVPGIVLAGRTAGWVHGVDDGGEGLDVAVPDTRQLVLLAPARVRRLAPSLLRGARTVDGHRVVSVETAVVQLAEAASPVRVERLVEEVVRRRLSTLERLRRRCGRGIAGSAALRAALDCLDDGGVDHLPRRLRVALEVAGVEGLESEVAVTGSRGQTAYLDLLHRPTRNAFEVDGWSTHGSRDRFLADRQRDRWVRREHGITTTRLAAVEVQRRLSAVVEEVLPLCAG